MGAVINECGDVSLIGLNPDKVDALIRCIEGAMLPDKQLLQHELKALKSPYSISRAAKRMVEKIVGE